ncbi:hypothetical protein SPRG_05855 [Saprolegnia parasitica CBS 223.65]|uniref:Peptidase M13 C-terminal domain-containing protein n=1 Tax=Saprolegnia parasitica (strain CBS 223.65) TaxID=695850 RepID=A0A067CFQ5_SAPPC|nr:hypothetical protein SPRG_05855 [Saprolegnia parasitica CBS 223.65]KDO29318.1 hypothetical protein SPRG_05855 [Saprolegnia parasitica CBS 223.65]|eukprot:XP_012199825.1 hypothetical protein SPRG_05855 [Saprolegnia parasitica CBS 223.65]
MPKPTGSVPLPRHQKLRSNDDGLNDDEKNGFETMAVQSSSSPRKRAMHCVVSSPALLAIVVLVAGVLVLMALVSFSEEEATMAIQALPPSVAALMDTSVAPCDDFYQYACGAWIANTTLPSDRSRYSRSFDSIKEANEAIFMEIVHDKWPLLSELFTSCMDTATLDAVGAAPLAAGIATLRAATTNADLVRAMGELSSRSALSFLVDAGIYADEKNSTINTLHVSQGGLTLPDQDYYTNATRFAVFEPALRTYVRELLTHIAYPNVTEAVEIIVALEVNLARASVATTALRDPLRTYNVVRDINASYPLVLGAFFAGAKLPLTPTSPVIVATPSFLNYTETLLATTPLQSLQTLFVYQYTASMAPVLSSAFRNTSFALYGRAIAGQEHPRPREKQCLSSVNEYLGELLSRYYLQKTFQPQALAAIQALVASLVETFHGRLAAAAWMDAGTKAAAIAKLRAMSSLLGYPSRKLAYTGLALTPTNYFGNVQQLTHLLHARAVAKLRVPVEKNEWLMHAHEVNAYYNPLANQIVFPAGILQPPFFDAHEDLARNYGAIGMVIGHEITHGFDDQGRNFDAVGNMQPWWSDATARRFEAKTACIATQYTSMAVRNESSGELLGHVNGRLTLGEAIADIGGLRVAFDAYTAAIHSKAREKLFFLSFAQSWCIKATDQALRSSLDDVHPPAKQRVNGAVMNNEAFARVFTCPSGAPLHPREKCNVW